jgi:hypothetical protein
MTLSQRIAAALDESTHALTPPCDAKADDGANTLSLRLTAVDSVGLAFTGLDFSTRARSNWTIDAIKSWGDRISSRVNYLMEPLKVVEIDTDEGEVQLRSKTPTTRADRRTYYEIRLSQQGMLHLSRFTFDESTRKRSAVNCHLTREVLERLADDLVASVS